MRRLRRLLLPGMVLATLAVPLCRAETLPLSRILPEFFAQGLTLSETTGHQAHFLDQGGALDAMGQLDAMIASQFATYPLGSTSGAFTFGLDPESGAYVPSSDSFGPLFAERPETLGRGKINLGVTSSFYDYDTLEGLGLDSGEIVFTLVHQDEGSPGRLSPFWEGDIIDSRLFLDLELETHVFFATFGVTDRLDLGIAAPYVRAEMNATVRSTILPRATGSDVHLFVDGSTVQDDSASGSESGLGDVVLRGKYNFRKGFAAAFDVRLPTGNEENLLGSGATQVKLMLVAGSPKFDIFYGGLHPHLNLGYTYSDGGYTISFDDPGISDLEIEPADEINYAVGFDAGLGRRITLAFDLVGRVLLDVQTLSVGHQDFLYTTLADTVAVESRPSIETTESDLSLLQATLGLKVNLGKKLLLTLSGIVPVLDDRGLEDDFTASAGLNYTF